MTPTRLTNCHQYLSLVVFLYDGNEIFHFLFTFFRKILDKIIKTYYNLLVMKEINSTMKFDDMMRLFDGKTEFVIVPSGGIMNIDEETYIGTESGTTSDPFVATVCDSSKVRIIGGDGAGPIYGGWEYREVRGHNAYLHNKKERPSIFLYEATNVKTGQKIMFNGGDLVFRDFYCSKHQRLTNKTKNGWKISEFLTKGTIDGKTVDVRIVPRIIKLSDVEIAENIEKARKRNESAIKRINEQIANEKAAILAAKNKITKLQEKLTKLVEKD